MNIYVAHPITGLQGQEVLGYFDYVTKCLEDKFKVLSPMTGKEHLNDNKVCVPSGYKDNICNNHAIFQRDMWMVQQSDIVLCDFTGSDKVSIGCSVEVCVASVLNKHTVVIMDKNNIHNHSFILDAADIIFDNLDDAINYLHKI